MDAKYLVLEAMSSIHHIFQKMKEYNLSKDIADKLLRSYAYLQHIRDDSSFIAINIDLNDDFLKDQRRHRLTEMRSPPFSLNIDRAIEYEEEASAAKASESGSNAKAGKK